MKALIVIPARWGSTRFPGKPLATLAGQPLIYWVWKAACRCRLASGVMVATDDQRIAEAVSGFGGEVVLTSKRHRSGTDRMAEVATRHRAGLYVNVQGDEPLLKPQAVDQLIQGMTGSRAPIGTLAHRVEKAEEYTQLSCVKVVTDNSGHALYFSRSPLPAFREGLNSKKLDQVWRHIGIYAFRPRALRTFVQLKPGRLEKAEALEQLRALENGLAIRVFPTRYPAVGVDTPEDLIVAERALQARRKPRQRQSG